MKNVHAGSRFLLFSVRIVYISTCVPAPDRLISARIGTAAGEEAMLNRLCAACMNTCKQESSAMILRCPHFRKRLSEDEFRGLLSEIDDAEARAADLSRRVKDLVAKAASGSAGPPPPDHTEKG